MWEYNRNNFKASLYDCTLSMSIQDWNPQGFGEKNIIHFSEANTIKKNRALYHIIKACNVIIKNSNSKLVFILAVYKKNIINGLNLRFDLYPKFYPNFLILSTRIDVIKLNHLKMKQDLIFFHQM